MNVLQWNRLSRDFKEERCILMLGPRMPGKLADGQWRSLVEELSIHLSQFLVDSGIAFDEQSKRELPYIAQQFLSIEGARRVDLEDISKDFLEQNTVEIPDIYHQLAQLPLHLIINTTPDDYMERALRERGKTCVSHYYNFQRDHHEVIEGDMITVEQPLVYNLFGTMAQPESLVLTDNNQLEFIRNVVKDDPRIPNEILGQFDHRKTYLFLGFNLENWQFRLLLDSLNLREENSTFSPKTPHYPVSPKTREFYAKRFSFYFVEQEMEAFTESLSAKIQPAAPQERVETQTVFIVSDGKDEPLQSELITWLRQMEHNREVELWYRLKFEVGTEDSDILDKIRESEVVLLLLSPDFLANDHLHQTKLRLALDLHERQAAKVFPILLRPSDWESSADLRRLSPLPSSRKPVTDASEWDSRDEAWQTIINEFKSRISR
ncbi:MAG: SIR2 family protein [Bacteroidota bacterium]